MVNKEVENLISLSIKKNRAAQRGLFDLFFSKITSICLRYSRDKQEAEDFAQNSFIKMFEKLKTYDSAKGSFEGWLTRIAVNECLQYLRSAKRTPKFTDLKEIHEFAVESDEEILTSNFPNEVLLEWIYELPRGYQNVLLLHAVDELSHKEIGKLLQITESTSRTQLRKARIAMKKKLNSNGHKKMFK